MSDIPLQRTPSSAVDRVVFPRFANGSGTATERRMINTDSVATNGTLQIRTPNGDAKMIILR